MPHCCLEDNLSDTRENDMIRVCSALFCEHASTVHTPHARLAHVISANGIRDEKKKTETIGVHYYSAPFPGQTPHLCSEFFHLTEK